MQESQKDADNPVITVEVEDAKPEDNQHSENNSKAAKSGSGGAAFIFLAIVFALGAVGFSFFVFQQMEQNRYDQKQVELLVRGEIQNKINILVEKITQSEQLQQQQQLMLNQHQGQIRETSEQLRISHEQLVRSVDILFKQKGRERIGWILAEAEYLLIIANHSLQLQKDTLTALAALAAADQRLHETGDPGIIEVREKISEELIALRSTPLPDLVGMQAQLTSLINQVEELPVLYAQASSKDKIQQMVEAPVEHNAENIDQAKDKFIKELKGLVVFRHKNEKAAPLMSPDEQFFLTQNLLLKLQTARSALLDGHEQLFRSSLAEADAWLERFYDTEVHNVINARSVITQLQASPVIAILPDISTSLKLLRSYQKEVENNQENLQSASIPPLSIGVQP